MFLSISLVLTLPKVSKPRDSGVTSSSKTSLTSPLIIAAWIAAPRATHSIGSTPRSIFLPTKSSTNFWTIGMRVGPPTIIILSISDGFNLASCIACSIGCRHFSIIGPTRSSNFARLIGIVRCFGPEESAEINGRFKSVASVEESSTLAFSEASRNLCIAILSLRRSIPLSRLNCSAI